MLARDGHRSRCASDCSGAPLEKPRMPLLIELRPIEQQLRIAREEQARRRSRRPTAS